MKQKILIAAAFCIIFILLAGCTSPKTSTIRLSGTPGLEVTGWYGSETGTPMQVSGTLPMSIELDRSRLREAEFRKTGSEGELIMEISEGMFSSTEIIASGEHTGVRASRKNDGSWQASNFR